MLTRVALDPPVGDSRAPTTWFTVNNTYQDVADYLSQGVCSRVLHRLTDGRLPFLVYDHHQHPTISLKSCLPPRIRQ